MEFLNFSYNSSLDLYSCKKSSSHKIGILGLLLSTDIGCRTDRFFTEWLDDPDAWGAGSNATTVDGMKDGTVEIRDVLDDDEGPAFVMQKEQYRKMVVEWQELCKQRPREIIITWDGKEVTVEGKG